MVGVTQYLWEQGRSDVTRESCNFCAKIRPLGKKQAKPADSRIFILFPSNTLAVKQHIWKEKIKVYWFSTKSNNQKTQTNQQTPPPPQNHTHKKNPKKFHQNPTPPPQENKIKQNKQPTKPTTTTKKTQGTTRDSVYLFTYFFTSATVKHVEYVVHIHDFFMRFGLCFFYFFPRLRGCFLMPALLMTFH